MTPRYGVVVRQLSDFTLWMLVALDHDEWWWVYPLSNGFVSRHNGVWNGTLTGMEYV